MIRLWLTVAVLMLGACGSGGGDDNGVPGGQDPPVESASVTGLIRAADGTDVDSDTNDPMAPSLRNNDFPSAQAVNSPVLVSGFVTREPTGVEGDRFAFENDEFDVFRSTLVPGQNLVLEIMNPDADLDLFVLRPDGTLVDESIAVGSRTDSIAFDDVPGEYVIVVCAFDGASSYVLTVGQRALASVAEAAFRPDELIVEWRDGPGGKAAAAGLAPVAEAASGPGLYRLTARAKAGLPAPYPALFGPVLRDPEAAALRQTRLAAKRLASRPEVAAVHLNHLRQPRRIPDDPLFGLQWHLRQIQLPQAWDVTQGSAQVSVAVIDTGVLVDHPELDALTRADGFDFISDPLAANDGDGIDGDPNDAGDGLRLGENSYHGTHVAGTVAAESDNGQGIAGTGWLTRILPIRALGVGGGTDFDITQGMRYAAGLDNVSGRRLSASQRADVINLSLGGSGQCQDSAYFDAVADVREAGVIVVAAAGNSGTSEAEVPASCPGVVSVSATDINREIAFYSNFGSTVDVAAPGGDSGQDLNGDGVGDGVVSTFFFDDFGEFDFAIQNGTSMAAPHVAGVAALMKAVNPALSPQTFDQLLAAGQLTADLGAAGRDDLFGHGLIDAAQAVAAANVQPAPFLVAEPETLYLGLASSAGVEIRDPTNSGAVRALSLSDDALVGGFDWLTLDPQAVDAEGLGRYRLEVDRSGLPTESAAYFATIRARAASGEAADIGVWVQVGARAAPGDVGQLYVILVDADSDQTVAQDIALQNGAQYSYFQPGVTPGDYLLVAGTDHDNDGFICDPGEACGGFPTLAELRRLSLAGGRVDLAPFVAAVDFSVSGTSALTAAGPARGYRRLPIAARPAR